VRGELRCAARTIRIPHAYVLAQMAEKVKHSLRTCDELATGCLWLNGVGGPIVPRLAHYLCLGSQLKSAIVVLGECSLRAIAIQKRETTHRAYSKSAKCFGSSVSKWQRTCHITEQGDGHGHHRSSTKIPRSNPAFRSCVCNMSRMPAHFLSEE
jgi:hypothetical protein